MPKRLSCGLLCLLISVTGSFALAQETTASPDTTLRGTLDAFEHPQQPQVSQPSALPLGGFTAPVPRQASQSKIVKQTVDLGSTIRKFAEQKKLPIAQARLGIDVPGTCATNGRRDVRCNLP